MTRNIQTSESERDQFLASYSIDPVAVAGALVDRVIAMADERARFRRSLMYSVEMIEAPELDFSAGRIH